MSRISRTPLRWFAFRFVIALICAWICLVCGLAFNFIQRLTLPACPASPGAVEGFDPVVLTTTDGIQLTGWWHPPEDEAGAVVILIGGHASTRDAMLPEARFLAEDGYGVLTADSRGCVGARATLGYREVLDVQAMVEFASRQPGVKWLAGLGFSAGGAALLLSAPDLPEIRAIIVEGNFASLDQEIAAQETKPFSLEWQIQHLTGLAYTLIIGTSPAQVSPIRSIPSLADRPMLFIYGELEVDRARGRQQFAVAKDGEPARRELWIVTDASHGGYSTAGMQEYQERILIFLENARHETAVTSSREK